MNTPLHVKKFAQSIPSAHPLTYYNVQFTTRTAGSSQICASKNLETIQRFKSWAAQRSTAGDTNPFRFTQHNHSKPRAINDNSLLLSFFLSFLSLHQIQFKQIIHTYILVFLAQNHREVRTERMNSLFSSSWRRDEESGEVQMTGPAAAAAGASLDKFFEDVEAIKDELKEVDRLHRSLEELNETGKTLHNASAVKSLRAKMDADVALALKKAKLIKLKLESLDRANAANRSLPGCGPGTSTDRTRTSVVSGLRKKLKDSMDAFVELRKTISAEYRETVERRYYTVTGEKPDEATIDTLIETGEGERFLQHAIEQQGRGRVIDVISEIQERHTAVTQIERSLLELQQVFMDMAVLVTAQGEQLDDIESQVGKARSFVERGREQLQVARHHQKSSRKWACFGIILLLVIILVIVLPIVLKNVNNKN